MERNNEMQINKKTYLQFISLIQLENWSSYALLGKNLIYTQKYPFVKIGNFLKRNKTQVEIEDGVLYKRATIKINGNGISLRNNTEVDGKDIGTKNQFRIKTGQFLLSKIDARNGAFGVVPEELDNGIITGNFWTFVVDYSKINPHYLTLLTGTKKFQDLSQTASVGTTNRNYLQETSFLNFEIPLPSLDEQESILNEYNQKVEYAKQLENEADELEKGINKFIIDKLGLNFNITINHRGLNFTKSSLFDRWGVDFLFKLNSLRFIKEGKYETKKVSEVLTTFQYGISEKAFVEPIGLPMLRMNNIYKSELVIDKLKYINSIELSKLPNLLLSKGDLLFNRTNSKELVGKTAIFDLEGEYLFASYLIRLKFDKSKVNVHYMNYLFNSTIGRVQIDMTSRQILGQANVNSKELQEFIFPIPPIDIQNEIVNKLDGFKSKINANRELSDKLRSEAIDKFEKEIFNL